MLHRVLEWQGNQLLRVQLLNKEEAERNYQSSRTSAENRQMPWLPTEKERKALSTGARRKLAQLERVDERARKELPGSISKLLKGYELRAWWFEVSQNSNPWLKNGEHMLSDTSFLDRRCETHPLSTA